jgi:hypothetical protein
VFDTIKPEGAARKSADVTKLRKVTHGLTLKITLDEGLEGMIQYLKDSFFDG